MKTLCYWVEIRECGKMVNNGFIIVTFYNDTIFSIEGVFTNDYLTAQIEEDTISLEYYSRKDGIGSYMREWKIPIGMEYFELPLNLKAHLFNEEDKFEDDELEDDELEDEQSYDTILVETIGRILDKSQKDKYERVLEKFKKNNNVFNS